VEIETFEMADCGIPDISHETAGESFDTFCGRLESARGVSRENIEDTPHRALPARPCNDIDTVAPAAEEEFGVDPDE
jgi:hypothetical protein